MIFLFSTWDWLEWQSPAQCYLWGRSVSEYFSLVSGGWFIFCWVSPQSDRPWWWSVTTVGCPGRCPRHLVTLQCHNHCVELSHCHQQLSPLSLLPCKPSQWSSVSSSSWRQTEFVISHTSHLRYNWNTAWLELFTKHLSIWASWRVVSGQLGDTEF